MSKINYYTSIFQIGTNPTEINFRDISGVAAGVPLNISLMKGHVFTDFLDPCLKRNVLNFYCTKPALNSYNGGGIVLIVNDGMTITNYTLYYCDSGTRNEKENNLYFTHFDFEPIERISFTLPGNEDSVFIYFSTPDSITGVSNEEGLDSFFQFLIVEDVETYAEAQQYIQEQENAPVTFQPAEELVEFGYVTPNT